MADEGRRRKSVYRKTGQQESPPREDPMPVENTPALVSSGFKRRQAMKMVQEEAASAKEEKDSKRRRTTDASAQVKAAGGSTVEQANERESRRRDSKEERREHREHKKESAKEEKKESREERKVRKEREAARKAAKDSKREGGSKDKEKVGGGKEGASSNREVGSSKSRGDSHRERKTMDEEEVGGASSKIVRASPRHRESKQSAVVVSGSSAGDKRRPPALATVEATSKEAGSRGVKEGKQLMDYSSREDKGKGKAPMYEEELAEYESLSKAQRLPLHKEIATDVPDLKRLQMLLELAVEAETEAVRKHLGSRGSAVAKMFEEATSQFIVESEGITISKLKRAASRKEPAKKLQTNPVNEAKHREEEELKAILAKFQAEEREWDREMTAPHSKSAAQTFVPLPPAGTMPSSSHPLMHELSIAHRNMLGGSSASETELTELLAWAQGYIATGLDRPRKALAALESRSNQVGQLHNTVISSMRAAVKAPFAAGATNAKDLLRSVAAS